MKETQGNNMTGCDHELASLAKGRRIILIRHGQVQQQKEKILLGQTNVPLSDKGKIQAGKAAERLAELAPETDRIYSSPLIRAKETAQMITGFLNAAGAVNETDLNDGTANAAGATDEADLNDGTANAADAADTTAPRSKSMDSRSPGIKLRVIPVDDLAEIALGEWDGKYISEIKEKYPERFMARGENLFSFDIGGGSENFYDLQDRVVNALKKILKDDPAEDIVIVSHKGVIRALENNLAGQSVDAPWDAPDTGDMRIIRK